MPTLARTGLLNALFNRKDGDPARQARQFVSDIDEMPAELDRAAKLTSLGNKPLAVITAGCAHPDDSAAATQAYQWRKEATVNEDVFNGSIRKFLKTVGVTAQREIEKAVRQALAEGRLKGNEKFPATATITLGGVGLSHEVKGEIELE